MSKERLDLYISKKYDLSRAYVQKLIKAGEILYLGKKVKASMPLSELDIGKIQINIPTPIALDIKAQDIPIKIIYQDSDLAIVHKPVGMVVHPAAGNPDKTMVNALLYHLTDLSGIGGVMRPGIVHRLDKDTEGLLIVAKNDQTHQSLVDMLKEHRITKLYRALLDGELKENQGTIKNIIGRSPNNRKKMCVLLPNDSKSSKGKEAVTHYKVLKRAGGTTLVDIDLETGRTHQIRVHFANLGFPLVGDPLYQSKKKRGSGQKLIAYKLMFTHPQSGEQLEFVIDLPKWAKD